MTTTAVEHRIGRDQVIWAFGPELDPVLEIDPGETVTFETNDCFTGQITSEDDLVTGIDFERVNSATGPVAVRGAEPGDSLVAEILDVRPIEFGFACLIPGFGQLIVQVEAPVTRMFRVEDGWIEMNERVRFPAKPMVGVVGVATDGDTLTNGLAGRHGGNLDDHLHGQGARTYFPVPAARRDVCRRGHARLDGRRRDLLHGRRDRRRGRHPLRPAEGEAGDLAGDRAGGQLGAARNR
jgi:amidase